MPARDLTLKTHPISTSSAYRTVLSLLLLLSIPIAAGAGEPKLSIDRLYSLPSLIGTAPTSFAWSADGSRLAFLWNDEGLNFRDVWVLEVEDPEARPERATSMPRLEPSPPAEPAASEAVAIAEAQERLERDPGVTSVLWHADGRRLLIGFRGDLWLVEPGQTPRNMTDSEPAESSAAYSPDGKTLAYLRDGDLWLMSEDGSPIQRTRLVQEDALVGSFRWSPDGSRIALLELDRLEVPERSIPDYLTDEPTLRRLRRAYPGEASVQYRLGLVPLEGSPLEDGSDEVDSIQRIELDDPRPDMLLGYRWSPDGERLAVDTSDLYAKDRRIYVVEADDRTAREVATDRDAGNETFYFWSIEWSADGQQLYFLSDRVDDYHVWAVEPMPEGSEPYQITAGSWAVAEMYPVEGGLIVVGNRDHPEERHLFVVSSAGGESVRFSGPPGTHAPTLSSDGRRAAVLFSNDATPPDLLLTAVPDAKATARSIAASSARGTSDPPGLGSTERRITTSPLTEFHDYRWVTPRYVSFPSHIDGTTLHGRLTLPPHFDAGRSYPAILGSVYTNSVRNQWGGRTAHPTWGLDQFLAQEGYVLLNVDMRGSWGRGREHRRGIRLDYGGMDIEDLESGVRFLSTLGYVDMDRVGIWGSSYGGLMTAMSLFRKPGLYAAGVAGAPATNVWHALTGQMAVMMRPADQPEEYADSSPFLHAQGLEDPLMIVHGMRDWVVLFKDSVVLVQRLVMLGKENVELVALPNAGHGWDNEGLAQTRFAFKKMVDFFDRHLKPCTDCGRSNDATD